MKPTRFESLGGPTNRPLFEINNGRTYGVLVNVGLSLEQIKHKKILDVCIGGGAALVQALQLGLDYHAIDILPLVDTTLLSPTNGKEVEIERRRLLTTLIAHPDRFTTANAAEHIPHPDDSFQIVMSGDGMPEYSRNAKEAIISVMEMIRISTELVALSEGWNEHYNSEGIVTLGDGFHQHKFRLKKLCDILRINGVNYKPIEGNNTHLITTNKNNGRLRELRKILLADAHSFTVPEPPRRIVIAHH